MSSDTVRDSRILSAGLTGELDMAKTEEGITAEDVRAARAASGLTQAQAAKLLYNVIDNWQNWEQGRYPIVPAVFELFLIKTGQFTLRKVIPGPTGATLRVRLRTGHIIDLAVKHAVVRGIAESVRAAEEAEEES